MTLVLVVAIPLAAAVVSAVVGGRLGRRTLMSVTTVAMALSFGAAASMVATLRERPSVTAFVAPWLPIPGADIALVVDSSMLAVSLAITGVSVLVALYSIGYLAADRGLQRYCTALSLLVAGALTVVLSANLVLLLAGWELSGVAAYLLIGHHREREAAAGAASWSFVIERIGDAALIAGTLLLLGEFHSVDLAQLNGSAIEHGSAVGGTTAVASVLLLIGAVAKSAQAPLHGWLPASAESPTPVAALLQTVAVTGGVVLLMRLRSVLVPDVLYAAAVVGGVTALAGAVGAIAQRDVRRALAWSTISQVGLMFVAAGLGALFAARFQLIAHALLMAVLVLGAGSVRRATGDESDLARYGGLGRRMPWTAGAFAIGTIALAGIPPAAGFFGRSAIVGAAYSEGDIPLMVLVPAATACSAFAGVRLFTLIFVAPAAVARDARERPPLEDIPLALLALGALAFGGVVSAGLLPIGSGPSDAAPVWVVAGIFAIILSASAAAWLVYRHGLARATTVEGAMARAMGGFGTDALYDRGLGRPFAAVARALETSADHWDALAAGAPGALLVRTSIILRRAHPATIRAQQTALLAGVLALLAFWTWSAR